MGRFAPLVFLICLAVSPSAAQSDDNLLGIPGFPGIPLPPKPPSSTDGKAAQTKPQADAPKAREPFNPQTALAGLFDRLSKTTEPAEARLIATSIQRIWNRTTSDTAEVLMARAATAMEARDFPVSLEVLDKLVVLEPDWAEAWNRRDTVRWLADDLNGSVEDIAHVLALEPRHFGALAGLAGIMERSGFDLRALQTWRRLKELYPGMPDIDKHIETLIPSAEGREI